MEQIRTEELKQIELDIFQQVIEICEKHNLRYIVDYGSLIGIVRHGGFIPWDDDIDVSMPRPDYEKFRRVFSDEIPEDSHLELRTGMKGNIAIPYIQVVHKQTVTVKKGRRDAFSQSVWVDVFPIDGAGNSSRDLEEVYEKYWDKINESRKIIGRYKPFINPVKQVKQFYWHYLKKYHLGKIINDAGQIMQTYEYDTSEHVFCFCTVYGTKEANHKKYYEDRIDMEFEGIRCKVPREYDEKLRGIYGDYMILPPEKERKGHDFEAYFLTGSVQNGGKI